MAIEMYNIAADCVDKHILDGSQGCRIALIDVREHGQTFHAQSYSFKEIAGLTNQCAHYFRTRGLKGGNRVLINLDNGVEFVVAFLGCIKAGLISIPSSPLLTAAEMRFLAGDSGAEFLIARARITSTIVPHVLLEPNFLPTIKKMTDDFKVLPTHEEDPAYWLYTSGTEGTPKAVVHAHRSIPAHDGRVKLWQDLREGDVVFNTSSLNWSYALVGGLLDILRHGGTSLVYRGEPKPDCLLKILTDHHVTTFMSVPGIYRRLVYHLEKNKQELKNLRVCLSAGEKLSSGVRLAFKKLTGLTIYEGFGMTEHSVYLLQKYGDKIVEGSCGQPVPEAVVAILGENLQELPVGQTGILACHQSSRGFMLGYHQNSGEKFACCQEGWFLSGDLAYRDDRGNFFYRGRRDDVITAGGYRISPLEVEGVLNGHPDVVESAVVSREIAGGKTIICAFVVSSSNLPTKKDILEYAARRLAKYKVPREIVFTVELPKTKNGKIKRKEIMQTTTSF